MFFPDKVAAFREAVRVLWPGGRFLFSVWGNREGSVWDVVVTVVGQFLSCDLESLISPPYNNVATVQANLAAAGLASITAEDVIQSAHSGSPREAAISQCHGGIVRAAIDAHMPDRLDEITEVATAAIAARFGSGSVESPLHAILFTAARPGGYDREVRFLGHEEPARSQRWVTAAGSVSRPTPEVGVDEFVPLAADPETEIRFEGKPCRPAPSPGPLITLGGLTAQSDRVFSG